jgi:hypothetical protein
MTEEHNYPAALADDPEEVSLALESGTVLWHKGERAQALRWLQRATLAATKANLNQRAGVLAQATAELSGLLGEPRAASASTASARHNSSSGLDFSDTTIVDHPAAGTPTDAPKVRYAVRVAVEGTRTPNVLSVRVLGEAEALPKGAHLCLLVPLEPEVDLTRPKK